MTTSATRSRAAVSLLLWLALLGGILVGLHALGGTLAPPPLTDPGRLDNWVEERQPAEAAFALLRLVGLGTAWYLLGATVLSALVRLAGVPAAVRTADLFTVPAVRRLANAVAGVSVAATLTAGAGMSGAGAHWASQGEMAMITLLAQAGTSPSTEAPVTAAETSEGDGGSSGGGGGNPSNPAAEDGGRDVTTLPTLRRLPGAPGASQPLPSPVAVPTSQPNPSAAPAPPTAPASQTPPPTARWEVAPGQHFWSVAEILLASAWQRAPSDNEVDPYWRRLVAANRSVLRDPDNPDLLYPGQVITVPPPPPAPPAVKNPNLGVNPAR